jgi:hypothetical protein
VVGIGEDDFGVKIVDEISGRKGFHGALGPDRHEDGRFNSAVGSMKKSRTGASIRASGLDFETKR